MKRIVFIFLAIYLLLLLNSSCTFLIVKHRNFTFKDSTYIINSLKINGYYYTEYEPYKVDSTIYPKKEKGIVSFLLYQDCTFGKNTFAFSTHEELEKFLINEPKKYLEKRDWHILWGKYLIRRDSIFIQFFSKSNEITLNVVNAWGKVLSDSSFELVEETSFPNAGVPTPWEKLPAVFKLKEFNQKPDSINWIKKANWYKK